MKPLKNIDKQALEDWDAYLKSIRKDTAVDLDMPYEERQKRLAYLEKHPLLWIKEMFPNYAKYEFASFHKKAIKRLVDSPKNWYEVLSWARELAKSTVVMFVVLFLVLTGKKRNIILCSNSLDNAIKLLAHYRAQLEANQRIRFYKGDSNGRKTTSSPRGEPPSWRSGHGKARVVSRSRRYVRTRSSWMITTPTRNAAIRRS